MPSSSLHNFLRQQMLPLSEIDTAATTGNVYDLGCGEGVIAAFLANNKKRKVVGVDQNQKRLPKSNKKNLRFEHADITNYSPKNANTVVISDVLHHIDYRKQKSLLKLISKKIKKNGVLIIKEIDTKERVRSFLSRFWDFVFYPKDKIYYHNAKEFKQYLMSLGFRVRIKRTSRLFPGSTTLFLCTKS